MIRFIRFYQKNVQRQPRCRFSPTCSQYAIEAYQKFNFFYATWLAIWRILRCNPLSKGGYNPVPLSRKEKRTQKQAQQENHTTEIV